MGDTDARLKELIAAVGTGTESSFPDFYREAENTSREREALILKENAEIFDMRRKWSNCVLLLIVTIVLFDILLVTFYGLGIWSFKDPSVVIAVITDNFLKILGLGFLITNFIFKGRIFR